MLDKMEIRKKGLENEEKLLLKDIYMMRDWKCSTKTWYWMFRDFSFLSIVRILAYYLKKKTKRLNLRKIYEVSFNFYGRKIRVKLRENDDDFSILRGTFLCGGVLLPRHKPYKIIIDGGAHIGFTAIYFAITNPDSKVYCFEPAKKNLELLNYNLNINNINSEVFSIGISNKEGQINFRYNFLNPSYSKIDKGGEDLIEMQSLDNIIKMNKLNSVDLLKLDIEGAEILALEGLKKQNSKVKEFFCENHADMYNSKELYKIIKAKGFNLVNIPHHTFTYPGVKQRIGFDPLIYGKKNLREEKGNE